MFIRATFKIEPKTGKRYCNYHLVESFRTSKGSRQRTLLYLGSELPVKDNEIKVLADRINDIIYGSKSLFACSNDIEKLAQTYAAKVIARLSEPDDIKKNESKSTEPELVNININSIEASDSKTVGAEHLILKMAEQLELSKILQSLGFHNADLALALGSIISRAVSPNSERATYNWLCSNSGLGELLDFDFKKSSLDKLYKISDKLLKHKDIIEARLEAIEQNFHGLTSTIALYDLTNTYMEGQAKSNDKAKHGVSKEKRFDCPLVTMGLVMNEHGFLNKTSFFPGNASESKTLKVMIEALSSDQSLFKPVIVMDAGIATNENLTWLKANNYDYIVSARGQAPSMALDGNLVEVGDLNNFVKAAIIKSDDNEEKWLYCESEAKSAVASQMKQSFKKRYEDDLKKISEGLQKSKGRKVYLKIIDRLGRLKEKHKNISACYEVNVLPSENGLIANSIEWKVIDDKMNAKLTGKYFLRTTLTKMGAKDLWQLYNTLRRAEDAFRFMKSSLGMRPVYHQKEQRVDGHLWITVLAYHLIQNCLYQLKESGNASQWDTIRMSMMSRTRITVQATTAENKTLYHRSTTKATMEQKEIYQALGISEKILSTKKAIL
jgi:transposase